jgi:hypothetical protein
MGDYIPFDRIEDNSYQDRRIEARCSLCGFELWEWDGIIYCNYCRKS